MTPTVTVRRLEPSDAEAIHHIFCGPNAVWGTLHHPHPSLGAWQQHLQNQDEGCCDLAACVAGEVVGHASLVTSPQPCRRHTGRLAVTVRDDMQGRGVGTALMAALVEMADNWCNLHRLELEVYTDNRRAVRLFGRFGFEWEGTLHWYAFRAGQYVNAFTMARVRRQRQPALLPLAQPKPAAGRGRRRTPYVTIRTLEPSDYAALHCIQTGPEVVRRTVQLPYQSVESCQAMLFNRDEGLYDLAACVEDELVGHLALRTHPAQSRRKHVGEFGIMVRDDMQGRGVGTALMQAAMDLADNRLNLRRLELSVDTDNETALRLFQRFGFVVEGTLCDHSFREGRYLDAFSMARLRPEG